MEPIMMTADTFATYKVGDLLVWGKTNSLCLVLEWRPDSFLVQVVHGGKYPGWLGEIRHYSRFALTEDVDFKHV